MKNLIPDSIMRMRIIAISIILQLTFSASHLKAQFDDHKIDYEELERMVDLSTGDFQYSIPVLRIPTTGEDYVVRFNYNAGITHDQMASWIGLGWSYSPGAINRQVSQIPDDCSTCNYVTVMNDSGESIINKISFPNFFQRMKNRYNLIDRINSYAKSGSDFSRGWHSPGFSTRMGNLAASATSLATFLGTSSATNGFYQDTDGNFRSYPGAFSSQGSPPISIRVSVPFYVVSKMPPSPNSWSYTFEQDEEKKKNWLGKTKSTTYTFRYYIEDYSVTELSYGMLYNSFGGYTFGLNRLSREIPPNSNIAFNPSFDNASNNQSLYSFSQLQQWENDRGYSFESLSRTSDYFQAEIIEDEDIKTGPIYLAADRYTVNAPGLNGELIPISFNNESLSASEPHNFYYPGKSAVSKYSLSEARNVAKRNQFVFLGDASSNGYMYSKNAYNNDYTLNYSQADYTLNGITRKGLVVGNQQNGIGTVDDSNSFGFDGNFLRRGVFVEDFTNYTLSNGSNNGLMEYASGANFIRNLVEEESVEGKKRNYSYQFSDKILGAFKITNTEGYVYHFSLPVHASFSEDRVSINEDDKTYTSITTMESPYAQEWLLTGITGPDFKDIGSESGVIDIQDEGYFIMFEYGRYTSRSLDRFPLSGGKRNPETGATMESFVGKEEYYLNRIMTKTHSALFVKGDRSDNAPFNLDYLRCTTYQPLKLDEIILITNDDYKYLVNMLGFNYGSNASESDLYTPSQVLQSTDIDSGIRNYLNTKAIRQIQLNHSYDLAKDTPYSPNGRLTLTGIDFTGKNNNRVVPSYKFDYLNSDLSHEPISYVENAWDGWGMSKLTNDDNRITTSKDHGLNWSLSKIKTPLGAELRVFYERDEYKTVSGLPLEEDVDIKYGGNLKVTSLGIYSGTEYRTMNFDYLDDNGQSSGVATVEPEVILSSVDQPFQSVWRAPSPSITYGQVAVERFGFDGSFLNKKVCQFKTSLSNQTISQVQLLAQTTQIGDYHTLKEYSYETRYNLTEIGEPTKIRNYNSNDNILSEVTYEYEQAYEIAQACHLFDNTYNKSVEPPVEATDLDEEYDYTTYRYLNGISVFSGNRVKSIVTKDFMKGFVSETITFKQDPYTGVILESINKTNFGMNLVTVNKPAYEVYPEMGHIMGGDGMKNQLSSIAKSTTSIINPSFDWEVDVVYGKLGIVNANARLWNNGLATNGNTSFQPKTTYEFIGADSQNVKHDGSYKNEFFEEFNFANESANPNWQKNSEIMLSDVYSHTLEVKDMNGNLASTKYNNQMTVVYSTAANAAYDEYAYSGAEDEPVSDGISNYFGGDIHVGSAVRTSAFKHTGQYSARLNAGDAGFLFYPQVDDDERYVVSFWSTLPDVEISVNRFDVLNQDSNPEQVNGWYQIKAVVKPLSAQGSQHRVGINNTTGATAYIDDFRFQPIDASVTAYAYNKWGELSEVLDNNNLFTRYEYDSMGRLESVYKETFQYGVVKVSENEIHYTKNK